MASREPMWYCHECNAEMRPLMVPDPTCASCHGTFVEKMENPADDPRTFRQQGPPGDDFDAITGLLSAVQTLTGQVRDRETRRRSSPGGLTFEVRSSTGGPRTFTFGGRRNAGRRSDDGDAGDDVPSMSEFLRRGPGAASRDAGDRAQIPGPILAQYLLALLGNHDPALQALLTSSLGGGDPAAQGRMGDYVYSQEALDQIITQLMETSNSHRPVPATGEKIQELPREVLEDGSPLLEKDCAVCKEQFKLGTEDPEEQIVVTLPCKHPFHEPCITPWLKSSGTCPVCRFALVPQPEHHDTAPGPSSGPNSGGGSPPSPQSPPRSPGANNSSSEGSGLFHSLFNIMGGNNGGGGGSSRRQQSASDRNQTSHIPGQWSDELD
ncbi:hypothetical protein HGRIS_008304 [Hohenbuehelia grisea]|uniref:RING-type domain-containing protein n=1 Tax=Hohenbuehelia grisea TaxID=104357 RepID=A0ABR3J821_9AGAR